jgi:hypothetical protein
MVQKEEEEEEEMVRSRRWERRCRLSPVYIDL